MLDLVFIWLKEHLIVLLLLWLKEHSLIVLLLLGTIFNVFWLYRMRRQLQMKWYAVLILSVLHTAIGVCSVKVFAFLESGDIGNMSLFGGVFFMPIAYWLGAKLIKRPYCKVCDVFTPCMLFTLMCARINCIVSGCCSGLVIPGTHVPLSHKGTRDSLLHCDADSARSQSKKEQEPRQHLPAIYGILRSVPLSLMNSSGRPLQGCCSISLMSGQPSHLRRDSAFT